MAEQKIVRPKSRLKRGIRIAGFSLLGVLAAAIIGFLIWSQIVMGAEPRPLAAVAADPAISVTESDSAVVMTPTDADAATGVGLVFVPGAKVDADAYQSTLAPLVDEGTTVVITKPILNLAFFDLRGLDTFTDQAPDVDTWLVGGHSLGGVKACLYAEDPSISGLILLGSYCSNDLSLPGSPNPNLQILSISGSQDGLSTPEKIEAARGNLSSGATFVTVEGANHASFGAYGPQPGDGEATISRAQASAEISAALEVFVSRF